MDILKFKRDQYDENNNNNTTCVHRAYLDTSPQVFKFTAFSKNIAAKNGNVVVNNENTDARLQAFIQLW